MTRAEKVAEYLKEGKWVDGHREANDYGEMVHTYRREPNCEEWIKVIYRSESVEIFGSGVGVNGTSLFFHDDPKPETRAERIKRLAATDINFVDFVAILHKIQCERKDLLSVNSTLRRLGIKVSEDINAALEMYAKKEDAADRTLEDVYGISWHGHKEAFAVCGLGATI